MPATPGDDLYVSSISANPDNWTTFEWVEPGLGEQMSGEDAMMRDTGDTGSLMLGLWRTVIGIAGCEPDGSAHVSYTRCSGSPQDDPLPVPEHAPRQVLQS